MREGPGRRGRTPDGTGAPDPWRWIVGTAVVALLAVVAVLRWEGGPEDASVPRPGDGASLVRLERGWPVMGTLFRASAAAPESAAARRALEAARSQVFRVDSLMSTYRDDSELSRINRAAGSGRWTGVSAPTARVLEAALAWARASDGAFDPTAGPLARVWGFHRGEPSEPPPARLDSAARRVGWEQVRYDSARRRVLLERRGMRLDFGAIAKGYALDRALEAMRGAGAEAAMVDLGGNVSVFGPPPRDHRRWRLGIRHPREDGRLAGVVELDSGSTATSGDTEQFFVRDGLRYSHIMDPRTGRPARGVAQVTVAAGHGIHADALATALFVLGPEEGRGLLESPEARRLAPGATAAWIRDPGADRGFGPEHLACAGPGIDRMELWPGETVQPPAPEGRARGPAPDTAAGGCRLGPPAGPE